MESAARLVASLTRWGVLRSDGIEAALTDAPWRHIIPPGPGGQFALWTPARRADGTLDPSPMLTVLLAELLELRKNLRVHVAGPRPMLLEHMVRAAGSQIVVEGPADRCLELFAARATTAVARGGFTLRLDLEPNAESLVKMLESGSERGELILDRVTLGTAGDPRSIHRLLALEGFQRRALEGRSTTEQDDLFREACESTWDPPAARGGLDDRERGRLARAELTFRLAYIHQFAGDPLDAIAIYEASIEAFPTAEAYTFLGWARSFTGDYAAAIAACEQAVDVDADFGNPYNDIGAYYLEMDRPQEALDWLERALEARRYDTPHFAHFNAGRALVALGRTADARREFQKALALSPGYRPASDFLGRLPREENRT